MVFSLNLYDQRTVYQCNYCSKNIILKENYIFKIIGSGEHNKKYICAKCLELKLKDN